MFKYRVICMDKVEQFSCKIFTKYSFNDPSFGKDIGLVYGCVRFVFYQMNTSSFIIKCNCINTKEAIF